MKEQETISNARIARLLFVLCVIQPFLDVLSYWMNELGYGTTLTMGLRMMLLVATAICGFLLSDRKRSYLIMVAVLALLAAGHVWACLRASGISGKIYDRGAMFTDLANFVRVAQLPVFALCFMTFLKRSGELGWNAVKKAMVVNLFVIAAVELISAVTGTNPYTYENKSIGLLGWFYFANSQSAILSMLVPLVLCAALKWKSFWKTVVTAIVCFGILWLFATRLSYLAIFATAFGTLIVWVVNHRLTKRIAALLLILAIACGATYSISPMTRNQTLVNINAQKKQEKMDRLMQRGVNDFGSDSVERYRYAYEWFQRRMVNKYGLERLVDAYNGSEKASVLADARLRKLTYCRMMLEELPASSRWFGLNYNDMEYYHEIFDVENDFHGILYLYGYAGFAAMAAFLLYFIILILLALIRNFKRFFTTDAGACGIALLMGLVHAYATAGVLRRPNATFYLSLVLALIWYLIKVRNYDDPKEDMPCLN